MNSSEPEETSSESVSIEVAYKQVQDWLKTIYGNKAVPHFEVNAKTVSILRKLMSANLTSNKDACELQKHQDKLSAFYALERSKICESLKFASVEMNKLSQPCQEAVESLSEAACKLDLKSPSTTDFLLCFNDLSRQQMTASIEETKLTHDNAHLSRKINSALLMNQQFYRELKIKEEPSEKQNVLERKRIDQTKFLQGKQEEYSNTVRELQSNLNASGVTPDVCHKALVKTSKEVDKLQAKLNEVRAKVKSFQKLPAHENLARLRIEEAKIELSRLEEELQRQISTE